MSEAELGEKLKFKIRPGTLRAQQINLHWHRQDVDQIGPIHRAKAGAKVVAVGGIKQIRAAFPDVVTFRYIMEVIRVVDAGSKCIQSWIQKANRWPSVGRSLLVN